MLRRTAISTGLGSALLLTGCSNYKAPTFETVSVREVERTGDLAVVTFVIEATNPNREPMHLGQASYSVDLNGAEVFSGVRSPEATVNTYSTHRFELPAVVPANLTGGAGELAYRLRGSVIYKNPGAFADVLFDAQVVVPEATLDLAGTIDLDS